MANVKVTKPTPITVKQAVKRITRPEIHRFVETEDLSTRNWGTNVPTLAVVRGMLQFAGGGFNQASWERQRITSKTTIDRLIKMMRSSDYMARYIRAWGLIENAGFYAELVAIQLEVIELLIDHYGEDKPYSELVAMG